LSTGLARLILESNGISVKVRQHGTRESFGKADLSTSIGEIEAKWRGLTPLQFQLFLNEPETRLAFVSVEREMLLIFKLDSVLEHKEVVTNDR